MLKILKEALTFDDVLLVPAYSKILPNMVDISTKLTNSIKLNIPILSAAMDTVTESNLAIAIAKEGGLGFIHKNMSIKKQVEEVCKVKKYKNHILLNLKTVSPDMSLKDIKVMMKKDKISGYPVLNYDKKIIGIITKRDIYFSQNTNLSVISAMTPKDKLLTVQENESNINILKKMYKRKVKKAILVDKNFKLLNLITIKDIKNNINFSNYASKDNLGKLRVGAAVDASDEKRIEKLIDAKIDVLLIDSSHGHSRKILKYIRKIRSKYPKLEIIGGNVATERGALSLVEAGVNAVKVGIGPGSICTTRIITGVGIPQITAIDNVANALKDTDIPIISDGGIRYSGDIAKAIAAGASSVMVGYMLAGTKESPGKFESHNGKLFKSYRGMGSLKTMSKGFSHRYFQVQEDISKLVPEGVEGLVEYKGSLKKILYQNIGGLKSCMGLTGCDTIKKLRTKAEFVKITPAGMIESHVHNLSFMKKSPNYYY